MEGSMLNHGRQALTSFSSLPNEILIVILLLLPPNQILLFNLVSRQFKDLARRLYYHNISFRYGPLISGTGDHEGTRFIKFLRANHQICPYVATLHLVKDARSSDYRSAFQNDLVRLLPAIQELSVTPAPALDVRAFAYLSILRLRFGFRRAYVLDPEPNILVELVARHFWMRSLRVLNVTTDSLCCHHAIQLFPKVQHGTSPITDLSFVSTKSDSIDVFPDILLCVKRLIRFKLEILDPWGIIPRPAGPLMVSRIDQGLRPHSNTLTNLVLVGIFPIATTSASPPTLDLTEYTSLKRLAITDTILTCCQTTCTTIHDKLPPYLESIQLQCSGANDMNGNSKEFAHSLISHKHEHLPKLGHVVFWSERQQGFVESSGRRDLRATESRHWVSKVKAFRSLFRGASVKFDWVRRDKYANTPFGEREILRIGVGNDIST
ncbi:hypothetical protein MMC13_005049 [Lambiella insularis]|nr:hypothetical protein [Lambiella insularis]